MYNNNLILDNENKISISQNTNNFFEIFKSDKLKDSIEIVINPFDEIDTINLYIIIKSYSLNLIYVPANTLIMVKNPTEEEFIVYNSVIDQFKNFSFYGFYNWFHRQLQNDWKYIKEGGRYSLVFTYPLKIFDPELLHILKPNYPWNSQIIENFARLYSTEKYYIMTIEQQKKELAKKQKIIEDLERIIKQVKK